MVETTSIDRHVIEELLESVGGDRAFLAELVDTYLSDSPQLLSQLHSSLAASNADEFRRAAHSLKSSSANLGALKLSAIAKELEMMGKAGALDGAEPRIAEAESEFKQVQDRLKSLQETNGG